MSAPFYQIEVQPISGDPYKLEEHRGKALLIVNTASQCGYTPQYTGLQKLYDRFKERGLVILGFPCNQFRGQEPGTDGQIAEFCSLNHGVSFPLYSKLKVNGPNAHPLFKHLKQEAPGILGTQSIKWNFTKFLVSPEGDVIKRYGSKDTPASIASDIEAILPS